MVNRLWQRYFGRGIVEPVDDWETAQPSHPELLDWLARELVTHDYDAKHIARLIFNSQAYQRVPTSDIDEGPTLCRAAAAADDGRAGARFAPGRGRQRGAHARK